MGILKRMSAIFQAKANKLLERVEDPRETLDLSYEKQLEMLQKLKRSLADVATARKRLELQAQQLQQAAEKLQEQAKQALAMNREDLARQALERRAAIGEQLKALQAQHEQLVQQEDKISQTVQELQVRIETFRSQKETIKATYTAAEAQTKVNEIVSGISEQMGDIGLAMQRAQDKVAQMQARAGALDELIASGALEDVTATSDPLQRELDRASKAGQVEKELEALKAQMALGEGTSVSAPQLGASSEEQAKSSSGGDGQSVS
jgi:phage shock protein A